MKFAFAGKGGVGKTTLAAWVGDYLARSGHNVWLIDADTALSLGVASGISEDEMPVPLVLREDIIRQRIGQGLISLTPDVHDLPETLALTLPESRAPLIGDAGRRGEKRLLVVGNVAIAGGGCACEANALLKALLSHLVCDRDEYVLVDMEAGVEHLGRGTVAGVDKLVIVSEPSARSLQTTSAISKLAKELGLDKQIMVMNRCPEGTVRLPLCYEVPALKLGFPEFAGLKKRMLASGSVLDIPEQNEVDSLVGRLLARLE